MSDRATLANAIRALTMDSVQIPNSGHPGAPMGMADIAAVLWTNHLNHNPSNPKWFNRDRFVDAKSARGFVATFDKFVHNWEQQNRTRYSLDWSYNPENPSSHFYDSIDTKLYYQTTENGSRNHSESIFGRVRHQDILFKTDVMGLRSTFRKETNHQLLTYGLDTSIGNSENSFTRIDNGLPPFPNRVSFAPATTTRAAGFFQTEFSPSTESKWGFVLGARLDYYHIKPELSSDYLERINRLSGGSSAIRPAEQLSNLTLAPRFDVTYRLNEDSTLYGKYSNGVRNPNAEELSMIFDHPPSGGNPAGTLTLPNPNLQEETSHAFEVGAKYADEYSKFHVAAFYTRYSNFIENGVRTGDLSSDGRDIISTVNRGSVATYGYEVSGSVEFAKWTNNLDGLEAGFAFGQTWGVDKERNTWVNSVEPWKATAWLGYSNANDTLGARLTGSLTGKVKHVNDLDGGPYFRPPSHFTLDMSAYYRVNDSITIQAGINNLLDKQYYSWGGSRRSGGHVSNQFATSDRSTAPGRNAFLSVTFEF